MPGIDVVDEAIIEADPSRVFEAILNEYEGATNWWMPDLEAKPRGSVLFRQLGGMTDITVHRFPTPRFAYKSTEIVKDKLIKGVYFEGDFLGTGEWTLEPLDGKTRVRFRWNVKTSSMLLHLISPLVGGTHSDVMQKGFRSLNRFLQQEQK